MQERTVAWRLLESIDRYDKGDELYNGHLHTWDKVDPKLWGLYHDPSRTTPARRKFNFPQKEKLEDVDPEEKPKPKLDLDKMKSHCIILVRQATGIRQITVDPDMRSPSGEYVKINMEGEKIWMRTDYLDQIFLEML